MATSKQRAAIEQELIQTPEFELSKHFLCQQNYSITQTTQKFIKLFTSQIEEMTIHKLVVGSEITNILFTVTMTSDKNTRYRALVNGGFTPSVLNHRVFYADRVDLNLLIALLEVTRNHQLKVFVQNRNDLIRLIDKEYRNPTHRNIFEITKKYPEVFVRELLTPYGYNIVWERRLINNCYTINSHVSEGVYEMVVVNNENHNVIARWHGDEPLEPQSLTRYGLWAKEAKAFLVTYLFAGKFAWSDLTYPDQTQTYRDKTQFINNLMAIIQDTRLSKAQLREQLLAVVTKDV